MIGGETLTDIWWAIKANRQSARLGQPYHVEKEVFNYVDENGKPILTRPTDFSKVRADGKMDFQPGSAIMAAWERREMVVTIRKRTVVRTLVAGEEHK